MTEDQIIDRWTKARRVSRAPEGFADRVAAEIQRHDTEVRRSWLATWLLVIEHSRACRSALCLVAFLVGSTPFFYVAYLAKLIDF